LVLESGVRLPDGRFGCELPFIAVHGSLIYGIPLIHMDVLEILKKVLDEVFPQKKVLCSNRFLLQMAYLKENKNLKN